VCAGPTRCGSFGRRTTEGGRLALVSVLVIGWGFDVPARADIVNRDSAFTSRDDPNHLISSVTARYIGADG